MSELQLPFYAMLFSLLLCFAYFLRKRINLIENRIYSIMLICSTIDCVLVVVLRIMAMFPLTPIAIKIISLLNKIDFIQLIIIATCLFLYMLLVTFPNLKKIYVKIVYVLAIIDSISILLVAILKVNIISNGNNALTIGGSASGVTAFLCLLYLLSSVIVPLLNIKHLDKRHIPMLFVVVSCIFLFFVYKYNPYLIVISITITLVNYLMYFTIENPDVKMLLEMKKSKDKLDKSNYDKSMFLFDMSKMVKRSTENINKIAYDVLDDRNIDKDNSMREIINEVSMLNTMCNKMFNINEVEASKIKIYNKKYDVKLLIKTLVKSYNRDNLNLSIDSNIPDNLYGDAITLKECLIDGLELFVNSDNIILNINSVNKNDILRRIEIVNNEITEVPADALVCANTSGNLGRGGEGTIFSRAGIELENKCREFDELSKGQAKVTRAYRIDTKYIIHTVVPKWYDESETNQNELLEECYKNIFRISADYDIKSIAIPTLGIGACRAPVDIAVKIAIDGIINNFFRNTDIDKIYIVCNDSRIQRTYIEYLNSLLD